MPFPPDNVPEGRLANGGTDPNYKPKRRSAKKKKQLEATPDPQDMIKKLQQIVNAEIIRLQEAIIVRELFPFETKQLELYVKMVMAFERKSNSQDFTDLSNEELLELAKKAIDSGKK